MTASMTATGLVAGSTYTGAVNYYADPGAPSVRLSVAGTVGTTSSATGYVRTSYVVFVAAASTAVLNFEPVGEATTPGSAVYVRGFGVYAGDRTGEQFVHNVLRAPGPPVVVYDHEARQGEETDYIVADADGVQLTSVRITIPAWGTWLKAPGRPHRNVRCYFEHEGTIKRAASRLVVDVPGGDAVVLSQRRKSKRGAIRLLALDGVQAAGIDKLLDDGGTLLLDTHPDWQVPYRYISVGDVDASRPYFDGTLGLDRPVRSFTLSDVVNVQAPVGVSVSDPTRSYANMPSLFGSYAAIAATVPTYEALATGEAA